MSVESTSSITFLNMSGDVTLTWDEQNHEKMIELVRKKMKEGYTFFTVKPIPFIKIPRKVKVTGRNIKDMDNLIIPDEEFDAFVSRMNDEDIAAAVKTGSAKMAKRGDKSNYETSERVTDPNQIVGNEAIAVRPLAGG